MQTRSIAAAAAGSVLIAVLASGAPAQEPPPASMATASITVENQSPVPQIVAGTSVPPFELPPHGQTMLAMRAPPPPPGSGSPVRFYYWIGRAPGPLCRGTVAMSIAAHGTPMSGGEDTHCLARSLATGGARCSIAVSARNGGCQGGLAFIAP